MCLDTAGEAEGNKWVQGWEAQLAHILQTSRNLSFADRIPQAAWRGRADNGRDWLRWATFIASRVSQRACTSAVMKY
jgi:hypothetical protein